MVDTVKGALNGSESALNGSQIEKKCVLPKWWKYEKFF